MDNECDDPRVVLMERDAAIEQAVSALVEIQMNRKEMQELQDELHEKEGQLQHAHDQMKEWKEYVKREREKDIC